MNKKGVLKIVIVLVILVIVFLWASFYFINKHKIVVFDELPVKPEPGQEAEPVQEEAPLIQGAVVAEIVEHEGSDEDSQGGGDSGAGGGGSSSSADEEGDGLPDWCKYIKNSKSPECYPG